MTQQLAGELPSARHVPAADGVRGLAILVVLIHNAAWINAGTGSFLLKLTLAVTSTGWVGVQLFFVLSGYLITGILVDALGSPRYFRHFYVRRTLRIFPLYYAALLVALFVVPQVAHVPAWAAAARQNQWWYWSYLSNWGAPFGHGIAGLPHFWSLAVEEQFYLCWPLLVSVLSRRRTIILCVALILVTPFIRLGLAHPWFPADAGYQWTVARWDALAAGALLALLMREASGRAWLERQMGRVTTASLGALVLFAILAHGFNEPYLPVRVLGQTLSALLSTALVYYCVAPSTGRAIVVQRALSAKWLRFLGTYSYAIYVIHSPLQWALMPYLSDTINSGDPISRLLKLVVYIGCILGLSTLAALLSWRVLEKPFLDLKDRLAPRLATRPAEPTASEA